MRYLFLLLILFASFPAQAATSVTGNPVEDKKIAYLLDCTSSSNLTFIRNGKDYTGKDARDHLQNKLKYAKGRIHTAEDFITYVASESSVTHEPYYVRLPDGTKTEAKKWLNDKLAQMK